MQDAKFFDEVAEKIKSSLPPGIAGIKDDIERNIKAILQTAFSKLDLVTRDEFDVQSEVLLKTRMKLEQLEKQVQQLEAILKVESSSSSDSRHDAQMNTNPDLNKDQ